jgi:hypothetical protein
VVTVVDQMQSGPRLEAPVNGTDEIQPGELVAGTLEEEHRYLHAVQVVGALGGCPSRRMERESKEHECTDTGERFGCGTRRHTSAKRLSPGNYRYTARQFRSQVYCRLHRAFCYGRRVGPPGSGFHIWELVAQRCHATDEQCAHDRFHETMSHTRSGTMRQDVEQPRIGRPVE